MAVRRRSAWTRAGCSSTTACSGSIEDPFAQNQKVSYAAGAMILDPADPSQVIARSDQPLMAPETEEERSGTVPNVVFPTAIEEVDGKLYVFYGMADAHIGVALLERTA